MTLEKLYTPEQIAEMLSLTKITIYRYIKEKKIKSIKIGNQYRIKESDYNDFIKG